MLFGSSRQDDASSPFILMGALGGVCLPLRAPFFSFRSFLADQERHCSSNLSRFTCYDRQADTDLNVLNALNQPSDGIVKVPVVTTDGLATKLAIRSDHASERHDTSHSSAAKIVSLGQAMDRG